MPGDGEQQEEKKQLQVPAGSLLGPARPWEAAIWQPTPRRPKRPFTASKQPAVRPSIQLGAFQETLRRLRSATSGTVRSSMQRGARSLHDGSAVPLVVPNYMAPSCKGATGGRTTMSMVLNSHSVKMTYSHMCDQCCQIRRPVYGHPAIPLACHL